MKKSLVSVGILLAALSFTGYAKVSHHKQATTHAVSAVKYLDINKASANELISLKGVGAKKAQAIVDYRKQNGRFKSVADLAKVKGISTKMLGKIERENPGMIKIDS
jgi:competence protein ComEA